MQITLPGGVTAVACNIGPEGLYFHMPLDQRLDDWVHLEFDLVSAGLTISAVGEVLRIERGARAVGVAMRLHAMRLHAMRLHAMRLQPRA